MMVSTGASSGIGRETALALGEPGAAVVLLMGQTHEMRVALAGAAAARRAGR